MAMIGPEDSVGKVVERVLQAGSNSERGRLAPNFNLCLQRPGAKADPKNCDRS